MINRNRLVIASLCVLAGLPMAHRVMAEWGAPTTTEPSPAPTTSAPATQPAPAAPEASPSPSATTTPAPAESAPVTQPAPASSGASVPTPGPVAEILKQLNLTPDQQTKVDGIQASAADQIKAILSPEQLKQLGTISEAGRADTAAFNTLNLSDEQKSKLNVVQMNVAQQLFGVLSPEQQQKLISEMTKRAKPQ